MHIVEVDDLTRGFRMPGGLRSSVLRNLDLTIDEGQTVGLLGVNGAGKTTLVKVISTLLLPDSGTVRVAGHDVVRATKQVRACMSVVLGGERGFYNRLSGRDNLRYFGFLSGLDRRRARERTEQVLDEMGLAEAAERRVETYSKGMKQRLHLAAGLMVTPRLLLLDEPTVGLDPVEAQRLRHAIGALHGAGVTILLTSHYMTDIEQLASRVLVLRDGTITNDMAVADLVRQAGAVAEVTITGRGGSGAPADLAVSDQVRVLGTERDAEGWQVRLELKDWSLASLTALAQAWPDGEVRDVRVRPASLDNVFAELTGADVGGSRS